MKWIKFLLPAVLLFLLAGCFDIDEEIDVNKNGLGNKAIFIINNFY